MFGLKRIKIADNEKALLFKNNSFIKVLEPGRHLFFDFLGNLTAQVYDVTNPKFEHRLGKFLTQIYPVLTEKYVDVYETNDHEAGMVFIDEKFSHVLAPASYTAFWKGPAKVKVDIIDINENFEVAQDMLPVVSHAKNAQRRNFVLDDVHYVEVSNHQVALLTINGQFERILKTGNYGFWKYNRTITINKIDSRLQNLDVSGQEILTKDRVSLRINLSGNYQVVDPEKAATFVQDYKDFLYKELQLELREAVGTKTLDELLIDKDSISEVIAGNIRSKMTGYGLKVVSVGVKDIILPGEMKQILNQVVEAQKQAEANLIKRREEIAATRSLHNTAKVMENNPTLMRLKELEALEKVAYRINSISVYDGLEGVMSGLIRIPKNPS